MSTLTPVKQSKFKPVVVALAVLGSVLATTAHAAVDVAPLVQEITQNRSGMETIMLAVLGIIAFIFGFKLLRRVFS